MQRDDSQVGRERKRGGADPKYASHNYRARLFQSNAIGGREVSPWCQALNVLDVDDRTLSAPQRLQAEYGSYLR